MPVLALIATDEDNPDQAKKIQKKIHQTPLSENLNPSITTVFNFLSSLRLLDETLGHFEEKK